MQELFDAALQDVPAVLGAFEVERLGDQGELGCEQLVEAGGEGVP
ncbi:hypothetical protein [Streptomyces sp. NPDC046631]